MSKKHELKKSIFTLIKKYQSKEKILPLEEDVITPDSEILNLTKVAPNNNDKSYDLKSKKFQKTLFQNSSNLQVKNKNLESFYLENKDKINQILRSTIEEIFKKNVLTELEKHVEKIVQRTIK